MYSSSRAAERSVRLGHLKGILAQTIGTPNHGYAITFSGSGFLNDKTNTISDANAVEAKATVKTFRCT